jgi:hypothetical protein
LSIRRSQVNIWSMRLREKTAPLVLFAALLSSACATIEPPACAVHGGWGVARASTVESARRLADHLAVVAPKVWQRVPGLTATPIDARFVEEMHDIPSFLSSLHGTYRVNGVTLRNRYDRWIEEPERGDAVVEKRVLAHELVHFWLGPDWDPLPHFLEEGLAENTKDSVVPEGSTSENLERVLLLASIFRGGLATMPDGSPVGLGLEALLANPGAELSFAVLDPKVVPTVRETLSIGKGRAAFARDSAGYGSMVEIGYLIVSRIGPEKLHALCVRAKAAGQRLLPPEWVLEAARLPADEHDEAWDRAILGLYGPLEQKEYARRSGKARTVAPPETKRPSS